MQNKKITLFVMTGDSSKNHKLVLSATAAKTAAIFGSVFLIAFVAILVDYVGLLVQASENKRLKAVNAQLEQQFQVVEGKIQALESSLERVKTFTTKLKLITNIDSEDRSLKLAMGATPPKGQEVTEMDEPISDRPDLTNLEQKESEFTPGEVPVNEAKGEVVVEGSRDYKSLAIRIESGIKESQLREQSVLELWESLSERQSLLNSTPNIKPAKGWFTSKFGYRISPFTGRPALHTGLDIAAAPGSPVYAPADGVVSFAGYDEGYGKLISIDHGYGITTRYGHNSQIYVQVGQKIQRWDVIGSVGNTGRSTGPHLHYEVRVNGVPRDPSIYILDD